MGKVFQFCIYMMFLVGHSPSSSSAIELNPTQEQMKKALTDGQAAARSQTPPSKLFWPFGSAEALQPHGVLMTKLSGLAVLSAHYAFRSAVPSHKDIRRVIDDEYLQVSITVFGSSPGFAVDSYILLKQGERLIKPAKVRSDARAHRSTAWPNEPPFKAKVVASFSYGTFDPLLPTTVSVFPGEGGEIPFTLDFSAVP